MVCRGIKRSVDPLGLDYKVADTVPAALALVEQSLPSVVLASHELNGFSASSLFAALRASPVHRSIPHAMMSGSPEDCRVEEDIPVFRKSPSLGDDVILWLRSLGFGRASVEQKPLDGVRLLVAEDTACMRKLMSHKLRLRGAAVSLAEDGLEAGVLGLRDPFDLIVLDIEMPRLDGRDACRMFRDAGITAPIVALTAHDDPETVSALTDQIGFDAVISKGDAIGGLVAYWESNGSGRVGAAA